MKGAPGVNEFIVQHEIIRFDSNVSFFVSGA